MVKYSTLDTTFGALSDPTRRAILDRLAVRECTVTQLAKPFDVSLPAISKHLKVLERAGMLTQEKDGRVRRCKLDAAPIKDASDWLGKYQQFWLGQLDSLATFLEVSGTDNDRPEDPGYEFGTDNCHE